MEKDVIEFIGTYKCFSPKSRFFIRTCKVNKKTKTAPKMGYTKTGFCKLMEQVWSRLIRYRDREMKLTITIECTQKENKDDER